MQFYWTEYSIIYLNLFIVTCAFAWLFWKPEYESEVIRLWRAYVFFVGLHSVSQIFMHGAMAPNLLSLTSSGLLAISNIGIHCAGLCLAAYFPALPQKSFKPYAWIKRAFILLFISHAFFVIINSLYNIIPHQSQWDVTNILTIFIMLMYVPVSIWHIRVVQKSQNAILFSTETLKDIRLLAAAALFPIGAIIFYTTYVNVAPLVQSLLYVSLAVASLIGAFILGARTPSFKKLMLLAKLTLMSQVGIAVIITLGALSTGSQLRWLYQTTVLPLNPELAFVDIAAAQLSEPFRIFMHQGIWQGAMVTVLAHASFVIGGRLFLNYTFLKPLNALLAAVTEVKSGNLDVSLQATSEDEFGILSTTFNEMVSALNAAQAEIKQANAMLESRVLERTHELAVATDSAEKANQAKTLFLAKMGHEFRTPLNAIMGFSQLIDKGGSNRNHADTIHKNGQHLLNLFDNILDAAQGEAQQLKLQPEPFDLPSTLTHLVQTVSLQADKKGLVLNYLPKDLPAIIVADAHRLQQILINLLTNAIKFTHSGSVTLSAETISQTKDKATIEFTVQDSGIGIAPADLAFIFAPFRQSTQQAGSYQEGSGLGLAISQQLVSLMDSKLHVVSTLNEGSTFSFYAEFKVHSQSLQPQKQRLLPLPLQATTPKPAALLLVLPSNTVLKNIRAAANIGDVVEIEKQLFLLAAEAQYKPFVQRIEGFLETYQMQKLRDWLANLAVQTPLGDSAEPHIRA